MRRPTAAAVLTLPLLLVSLVRCADSPAPTAAQEPERPSAALAGGDGAGADGVTALGTIALPINQSVATAAPNPAFRVTQTGTGPNGGFVINNATNAQPALQASTNGTGRAGSFTIANSASAAAAVSAQSNGTGGAVVAANTGTGSAGVFYTTGTTNAQPALQVTSTSTAPTILARNNTAAYGLGGGAAFIEMSNTLSGQDALRAENRGRGAAGSFIKFSGSTAGDAVLEAFNYTAGGPAANVFSQNATNLDPALLVVTNGSGWAGDFRGTAKGVRVTTNAGGAGLQVVGGSKNAVVGTATGARALYTEESAEVWFTDYGFGKLEKGRARILFDPTFAQTINPEEPYHVFVEPYGRAELYVAERTPLGFVIALKDGEPSVEFSYRIVAKRRGFEGKRLERAPWADEVAAGFAQSR